jgi:hypothetical protein
MPRNRMIAIIVGGSALCAAAGASLTATTRQVPTVSLVYTARTASVALPTGQDSLLAFAEAKDAAAPAGGKLTVQRFNSAHKAHMEHIKHVEHMEHMARVAYMAYVAHEVHVKQLAERAQEKRQAARQAAARRVVARQAEARRAAVAARRAAAHRVAARRHAAARQAATRRAAAHRAAARRAAAHRAAARRAAAHRAAARRAAAHRAAARRHAAAAGHSGAAVLLADARQQRSSGHSSARSQSTTVRAGSELSGSPQEIAQQLLDAAGQGSQFSCLDALWTRESGWNPYATNPTSGAYGIPQALPAIKMASTGADWRTNVTTQVRWGLSYIDSAYGSPCAAWSHEERVGWY